MGANFMMPQNPPSSGPLLLETLGDLAPLRQALRDAGYTPERLAATLDLKNPAESVDVPVMLRRTAEPTPFHTFVRLFYLGQDVDDKELRVALGPVSLEVLLAGGLLQTSAGGVRSTIKLAPHQDMYFASDFSSPARPGPIAEDHVLGVGPASITLSVMTLRHSVDTVLDVGCGAGVQSLLCAAHAQKVVGTDICPRALNFAAFNTRLNGVKNVEWRQGSFFDPVAQEKFDLIVANPPFVISPKSQYVYRDSGMSGDAVSEQVVKQAAAHLKEGGFATVLINWYHQDEEDWETRPRAWLQGLGCDGWIARWAVISPLNYAASWLRFNEARDPDRYGQMLDEWLAYYERLGARSFGAAAVVLRKRAGGDNWIRCDTGDDMKSAGSSSGSIARVFAAEDFLQHNEAQLADQRLVVHSSVAASQRLVIEQGRWSASSLHLTLSEGFPFSGNADVHILQLLAALDGRNTVREAIQKLASLLGASYEQLAPSCLLVVKKLLRSAMLEFAREPERTPCP